mgnify:CR=1 FL=1
MAQHLDGERQAQQLSVLWDLQGVSVLGAEEQQQQLQMQQHEKDEEEREEEEEGQQSRRQEEQLQQQQQQQQQQRQEQEVVVKTGGREASPVGGVVISEQEQEQASQLAIERERAVKELDNVLVESRSARQQGPRVGLQQQEVETSLSLSQDSDSGGWMRCVEHLFHQPGNDSCCPTFSFPLCQAPV